MRRRDLLIGSAASLILPGRGSAAMMGSRRALLGGTNWTGFLPQSSAKSVFDIQNILLQSNDFSNAAWGKFGTGIAAPTITPNSTTAPDGTLTASTLSLPAISSAGTASGIYQRPAQNAGYPYTADIYVRGVVGGEVLWIWGTPDGVTFTSVKVTATLAWQRVSVTWARTGGSDWYYQIGRSLSDGAQTSQPAASVYLAWAQVVAGSAEQTYVPTTSAAATQSFTVPCPSNIRFRDFSGLTAYAGNPIIAQNTHTWNQGSADSPSVRSGNQISGTLFAPTENNQGSQAIQSDWNQLAIYTAAAAAPLAWTVPASPVLTNTVGHWDEKYLLHPSIVQVGGSWYMYYSGQDAAGNSAIGLATATDPINGPWSKFGTAALVFGGGQGTPSVIRIGNLLYMYVSMGNVGTANNGVVIFYYTSPASDGVVWTLGGIALAMSTSDWENVAGLAGIFDPFVFQNSRGFYEMVYTAGNSIGGFHQLLGCAISADGKKWFKYQPAALPITGIHTDYAGDGVFFQSGDKFYLFTARSTGGGTICEGAAYTMANH